MNAINSFSCATAFGNTGTNKCAFAPKEVVGMFIVPKSWSIKNDQVPTLQTYLEQSAKSPSKSSRIYPVHNFVGFTDSSEDVVRETLGYGETVTIRDGNYNWMFRFVKGGMCLLKSLRDRNGSDVYVVFIDKEGNLIGTIRNGGLAGIPISDFWAPKWTLGDGSGTTSNFSVFMSFKPEYINERLAFIQTKNSGLILEDIQGLQDLLAIPITAAAGTANVYVVDKCSGNNEDVADLFGDDLAEVSLWSASSVNGTAQTISAVAFNPLTKSYTLTFTPVRTVGSIISLASVDVLEAADIVGFEGSSSSLPLVL